MLNTNLLTYFKVAHVISSYLILPGEWSNLTVFPRAMPHLQQVLFSIASVFPSTVFAVLLFHMSENSLCVLKSIDIIHEWYVWILILFIFILYIFQTPLIVYVICLYYFYDNLES